MATILENEAAWSTTAATNANVDTGINWAEGQDAATVNNSARGMMAARRKAALDQGGNLVAGGTANALTVTTNQVLSTAHLVAGLRLAIRATATNTSTAVTFAPDGLTAANIKQADGSALAVGDIINGMMLDLVYNSGSSEWRCVNLASNGPSRASFKATKGGVSQAITAAASLTKVTFATEIFDAGSLYASSAWTPPAGTAVITTAIKLTGVQIDAYATMYLYKNNAAYLQHDINVNSIGEAHGYITTVEIVNGTDYFEVYVASLTDASYIVDGGTSKSFFAGSLL